MGKVRLDVLLYERGLAPSREKARAFILAGEVMVDGKRVDKPGTAIAENAPIELALRKRRYVSRGGLKLEKALDVFRIDVSGRRVLDIGASTGGYTDCVLQRGASQVWALDVGYGQLDWSLRNDSRVKNLERTNIRYFTLEELGEKADIITIDVSFISLALVFPAAAPLLQTLGFMIALVKPQFEAGKDKVGKNGVVRNPWVHREVLEQVVRSAREAGLACRGLTFSPITGPKGNIEYFLLLQAETAAEPFTEDMEAAIAEVVNEAHKAMGGKM